MTKLRLENGAAAYELPLACFPGIGPGSFPPMVFLGFWDSIPKRCKGVHCVDLGESFPTRIYLQKIGVDTAENEPLEVWGENSVHFSFASCARIRAPARITPDGRRPAPRSGTYDPGAGWGEAGEVPGSFDRLVLGCIKADSSK